MKLVSMFCFNLICYCTLISLLNSQIGIQVKNYKTLWEGCNSIKSKKAKLMALLEENGMKGNPTIEKCRKLRKKLERAREVAELDTSNIINTSGNFPHSLNFFKIPFELNCLYCRPATSRG